MTSTTETQPMPLPAFPIDAATAVRPLRREALSRQEIQADDPHLACEIASLRGWRRRQRKDQFRDGLQTVAAWVDPRTQGAGLRIGLTRLPREINPADLVRIVIHRLQGRVVHERIIQGAVGELPDILSLEIRGGQEVVVRRNATKDGDRCFVVEATARPADYGRLADELLVMLASFKLTDPEGHLTAEPLQTLAFPRPRFRTAIPSSWRIAAAKPPVPGRMRIELRDASAPQSGEFLLDVTARSDEDTAETMLAQRLQELESRGLRGTDFEPIPWNCNPSFHAAWRTFGTIELGLRPQDFRLAMLDHPRAAVLINSIGPTFEEDPPRWAVTKRLFELVCQTADVAW